MQTMSECQALQLMAKQGYQLAAGEGAVDLRLDELLPRLKAEHGGEGPPVRLFFDLESPGDTKPVLEIRRAGPRGVFEPVRWLLYTVRHRANHGPPVRLQGCLNS